MNMVHRELLTQLPLRRDAVDEQGDQEGSKEGAYNPAHDHSCRERGQRSRPQEGQDMLRA